ncbi:MAG: hypothetical protein ABWY23_10655 [Mycetocola sp.]
MPDRRTVKVAIDYGYEWPLEEDEIETTPEALDLSPELTQRLRTWLDFWDHHFHYEHGWDSPEHKAEWCREGRTVSWDLRLEVAEIADVVLDIDWCGCGRSKRR